MDDTDLLIRAWTNFATFYDGLKIPKFHSTAKEFIRFCNSLSITDTKNFTPEQRSKLEILAGPHWYALLKAHELTRGAKDAQDQAEGGNAATRDSLSGALRTGS